MVSRPRRALRLATALMLVVAASFLAATHAGRVPVHPGLVATLVGLLGLGLLATLGLSLRGAIRGPGRWSAAGETLLAGGLLGVALAGLANWALAYQGAVLVQEHAPIRLDRVEALTAFEAGPLADRRELAVTVALAHLDLAAAGRGAFRPESKLRLLDAAGHEQGLVISPSRSASVGRLLLHQGAFGFAPRVQVRQDGRLLLDTNVPFRTIREGPDGIAFVEDFEIASEKLLFHAAISLEDLNDDMRGHPKLDLAVERAGAPVGRGSLRPGDAVTLEGGLTLGFSGLQRWSEVLISRRTYTRELLASAVLALLGALLWPVAAWRKW
jgi:hypothetical protein